MLIEMRKKIQLDLNESKEQMRKRCELVLREQKQELIGKFLSDYEEVRTGLEGVSIPYNIIIKIDSLKEKWEKMKNKSI